MTYNLHDENIEELQKKAEVEPDIEDDSGQETEYVIADSVTSD